MTWATDHLFVAGGDYVSEFWRDFQEQAGVGAVITVSPERPPAYLDPAPWAALWLPVDDEAAYTLDQLALGVQFIDAAIAAGYKLLLHGPHGVHRTRPLVAAHLVAQGLEVVLLDMVPPGAADRSALARKALQTLARLKPSPLHLPEHAAQLRPGNFEDDWKELAAADWVFEAVVEDMEVKRGLLARWSSPVNSREGSMGPASRPSASEE